MLAAADGQSTVAVVRASVSTFGGDQCHAALLADAIGISPWSVTDAMTTWLTSSDGDGFSIAGADLDFIDESGGLSDRNSK